MSRRSGTTRFRICGAIFQRLNSSRREPVPDRWFLPSVEGRLTSAVETRHPTEVSLLVNLTPAERFATSSRVQNRNLGALLPATKVLSEVDWHNAKFSIELLDLSRRRVAFRQDDMQIASTGPTRGEPLTEANAGTIDVKALANRRLSADFFLNQIAQKIQAPAAPGKSSRVVIILSASVSFEPGVEMHPIGMSAPTGCDGVLCPIPAASAACAASR